MALQEFLYISRGQDTVFTAVSGDCLEGAGIDDGDTIKVDLIKMPIPPKNRSRDGYNYSDICLCFGSADPDAHPAMMVKEYCGTFGTMQQVGTRYKWNPDSHRMNFQFEPIAILGVVYECYDKNGALKWARDVSGHPETLPTKNTTPSGNISMIGRVLRSENTAVIIKEEKLHA